MGREEGGGEMDENGLTIIAVDPGKVSGWAHMSHDAFYSGQMDWYDHLQWIDRILTTNAWSGGNKPVIVVEDFIYTAATAKKSRQTWSTEAIGVLRFMAFKHDLEFVTQTPAAAKRFATDDKLKNLGWYTPTKGGHANDAARHMLLYCVSRGIIKPEQLILGENYQ